MFSVFNANLQTDMVKTIVRRHLTTTDTRSVWRELSEHRRTSSKGVSEKRRLTLYKTNIVPDDNFKGTIEQFVLHLNEQFRQLDEITDDSEKLPSTVKLTLLQTALRSNNNLRIVESMDEIQSTTHGHPPHLSHTKHTMISFSINTSLAYCALLDVLWQMCHAWITYGMVRRTAFLTRKSYEANDGQQGTPHSACLHNHYDSSAIFGSHIGVIVGLPLQ